MNKLDRNLLNLVKQGFVPQPGGQGEPVAGASQMTAGMGAPMGVDPSQGGAPMDPSMAGGDPSQGGAAPMPPSGMDPAMAGMVGGGGGQPPMQGSSMLSLSVDDLIKLFKVFQKNSPGGAAPAAAPAAPAAPAGDPRLDHIIQLLQGAMQPQS